MSNLPLIDRKTELSAHMVGLSRYLRKHAQIKTGPAEIAEVLQALSISPIQHPEMFKLCVKSILIKSKAHLGVFDELYAKYWKEVEASANAKIKEQAHPTPVNQAQNKILSIKEWLKSSPAEEEIQTATYSANPAIGQRDFSSFTEEDLIELYPILQSAARSLARKLLHSKTSRGNKTLDYSKTIRRSLSKGGEYWELVYKERIKVPRKLVLLCDVSKSMELYARLFLQFMYTFQLLYRPLEAFVFGTQLHPISSILQKEVFAEVLNALQKKKLDWNGGTQIGSSLHTFISQHPQSLTGYKTVVIILSDGWDTGETALLQKSMQFIHKKAHKVIWLNPLAGNPNYQPSVKGMQTALPYIDVFAPCHNINSLRGLSQYLK
ncbi:VWA domain-containing protein [Rapidithrix thailandica]|uniref:VWA domain-containing protein n=1 Tax=Rapidithrix thailandica TaxID=413964 RepID=A0AAW9S042_9BACT